MREDLAKQWSAELRSGKWDQTRSVLCVEDNHMFRYCCLGVACEIAIKNDDALPKRFVDRAGDISYGNADEDSATAMPRIFRDVFDVGSEECDIRHDLMFMPEAMRHRSSEEFYSLAALNDGGLTFDQIADVIDYFWDYI